MPNRVIRHGDPPFGEEIFDIPETQAETVVEPDGVTDDFRGKSVSAVGGRLARHRATLPLAAQLDNASRTYLRASRREAHTCSHNLAQSPASRMRSCRIGPIRTVSSDTTPEIVEYSPRVPSRSPLAGLVEIFFHLKGYEPTHRFERLVPDGRIAIVIELDDAVRWVVDNTTHAPRQRCVGAWVSGVHCELVTIGPLPPSTELCTVQFRPGTALPIVQRPLSELNDRVVDAESILGPEITDLRGALIAARRAETKLDLIQAWLETRFDPTLTPHGAVTDVVARMTNDPMTATLADATRATTVSRKHLVDLFKRHVGPTPKGLHRILRFAGVLAQVQTQQPVNWAAISAAGGYADQSHLIKDFSRFSGWKPSEFLSAAHDRQNFFPVSEPGSTERPG